MSLNAIITDNLDDEWESYMEKDSSEEEIEERKIDTNVIESYVNMQHVSTFETVIVPEPTPIHISTKSEIFNLNVAVDLETFWKIPVIPYSIAIEGCIKKQAKINSKTAEELELVKEKLANEIYYQEHIISHIDNPYGRIPFKDVRRISIGLSKKDLINNSNKKKHAFYNCIALIMRIFIEGTFKEFHVKLFNTGKIEIPGIKNDETYRLVLGKVCNMLQQFYTAPIFCKPTSEIVLINSNFNCGFYINRENLHCILKNKYNIQTIYDPCYYPGVKAVFYYNKNADVQTGEQIKINDGKDKLNGKKDKPKKDKNKIKIKDKNPDIVKTHFAIFRTGSVLILGTCNEEILHVIYNFLITLLRTEFKYICTELINDSNRPKSNKDKKRKVYKKMITLDSKDDVIEDDIVIEEDTVIDEDVVIDEDTVIDEDDIIIDEEEEEEE